MGCDSKIKGGGFFFDVIWGVVVGVMIGVVYFFRKVFLVLKGDIVWKYGKYC